VRIWETVQYLPFEFFQCATPGSTVSFQPFTHTVGLRFRNKNPSRTIAINFVTVRGGNDPRSHTQPCQGAQCDGILGPCFVFLEPSPDPANPPPGAISPQLVYDCAQVQRTPLPPGTNLCLSPPIMEATKVIVQATYCTFDSPARPVFCGAGKTMLQTLQAFPSFPYIEVLGCP
jgi:hypothetical protein